MNICICTYVLAYIYAYTHICICFIYLCHLFPHFIYFTFLCKTEPMMCGIPTREKCKEISAGAHIASRSCNFEL